MSTVAVLNIAVDKTGYKRKPNKAGMATIKKRLHEYHRELDVALFADMVGSKGHTFYCGTPTGMIKEHWNGQQVVVLDYDDEGIRYNDVYQTWCKLGLAPTFSYKTLSYTDEHNKFRLVWVLNERVSDFRVAECITGALIHISQQGLNYAVDKASKSIAQAWLGGKGLLHTNFNLTLDVMHLFDVAVHTCDDGHNNTNRNLAKLCKEIGLNQVNNVPMISPVDCIDRNEGMVEWNGLLFDFARVAKVKKDGSSVYAPDNTNEPNAPLEQIGLDEKYTECKLLVSMLNGEHIKQHIEENHELFFALATNLHTLEYGETLYKRILEQGYTNADNKLNAFRTCRSKGYTGCKSCDTFCSYHGECGAYSIKARIQGSKRFGVVKLEDVPLVVLQAAREALRVILEGIMCNHMDVNGIHLVKIPTGVGKTYFLQILDSLIGYIVATPTHELCKEFQERRGKDDMLYIKELVTKNMHKEMIDSINMCYMMGDSVYRFLTEQVGEAHRSREALMLNRAELSVELMKANSTNQPTGALKRECDKLDKQIQGFEFPSWYEDVTSYLKCIDDMKIAPSMLMTHKRLSYSASLDNKSIHTMIFDEDPLETLLAQESVNYDRLMQTLKMAHSDAFTKEGYEDTLEPLQNAMSVLKSLQEQNVQDNPLVGLSDDMKKKIKMLVKEQVGIDFNIMGFFNMAYLAVDEFNVHGMVDRFSTLPNKKIVILSASADETIWRMAVDRFAPNRQFYYHEVPDVEYQGQLIMQTGRGYSRSADYVADSEYIGELSKQYGINQVITFKGHIEQFKDKYKHTNLDFKWFGNCLGYDGWNGKDLLVIGTPHRPSWLYDLWGYALTGKRPVSENWTTKKVTRHGFEFPLNTYTSDLDEAFTSIQLYFIYSDLCQAIGRSRLISNDCRVVLVCNIAPPQATLI